MRALIPLVLIATLAACHGKAEDPVIEAAEHAATLPCALAGSPSFSDDCTVERVQSGAGLMLILHHPDGGFRKLLVTTDGRGVITADGAQQALVAVIDPATIQVGVDRDRYRLPATIRGRALPAQ